MSSQIPSGSQLTQMLAYHRMTRRNRRITLTPPKNREEVLHEIRKTSSAAFEGRQLTRRLKGLLPDRLKVIDLEWRQNFPPSQARRRAITDKRYEEHLLEILEISSNALANRIRFETLCMLIKAEHTDRTINALCAWNQVAVADVDAIVCHED